MTGTFTCPFCDGHKEKIKELEAELAQLRALQSQPASNMDMAKPLRLEWVMGQPQEVDVMRAVIKALPFIGDDDPYAKYTIRKETFAPTWSATFWVGNRGYSLGSQFKDTGEAATACQDDFDKRVYRMIDATPPTASHGFDVEKVRAELDDAAGCINAAYSEGLLDKLAEETNMDTGSLHDLVTRRVLHTLSHIQNAYALLPGPAQVTKPDAQPADGTQTQGEVVEGLADAVDNYDSGHVLHDENLFKLVEAARIQLKRQGGK